MLGFIDESLKLAQEYNNLKNSDRVIILPSEQVYTNAGDTAYFIYDQELVEVIYDEAEINYKTIY